MNIENILLVYIVIINATTRAHIIIIYINRTTIATNNIIVVDVSSAHITTYHVIIIYISRATYNIIVVNISGADRRCVVIVRIYSIKIWIGSFMKSSIPFSFPFSFTSPIVVSGAILFMASSVPFFYKNRDLKIE